MPEEPMIYLGGGVENSLIELMTPLAAALSCAVLSHDASHRLSGLWRSAGAS